MKHLVLLLSLTAWSGFGALPRQAVDPHQALERTCFQTSRAYGDFINLRSDVAIVYGIDPGLPNRIQTWRDRGYRIHVMTGVSWGQYQDYLYGRFDGVNHEDEAQTERSGKKITCLSNWAWARPPRKDCTGWGRVGFITDPFLPPS